MIYFKNIKKTYEFSGLTIDILLTQDIRDIGYYTPFDGLINQENSIYNFVFTSDVDEPYRYYIYNTSQIENKFLSDSTYHVDWGDGSPKQNITGLFNAIDHLYPEGENTYEIKLTQYNSFGDNIITKKISTPYKIFTLTNPNGKVTFKDNNGSWVGSPSSQDYIFNGDSLNNIENQISDINILITGHTKSRLSELSLYGTNEYQVGVPVIKYGDIFGVLDDVGNGYTGYTIQGIKYFDYPENITIYIAPTSGITSEMISSSAITKEEHMMHVVSQVEIQTDVFVERGKNSVYERIQRIGEVQNLDEMEEYGNGFFDLRKTSRSPL
jgi:hypothetical protein